MTNRQHPKLFATFGLALVLVACPSPKMPEGPPPEYEEPTAPSWYGRGADASAEDASEPGNRTDGTGGAEDAPPSSTHEPTDTAGDAATN